MSTLMPSRIRHEGVALYHSNKMTLEVSPEGVLKADFTVATLRYMLVQELADCDCHLFRTKGYCQHLAAVEHYLTKSEEGKILLDTYIDQNGSEQVASSIGRLFLEGLPISSDGEVRYRLSAHGTISPYSSDLWWTLKINRLPNERSYVIKDIPSFLHLVRYEGDYQIGKNYYEPLSLNLFDEASQSLIHFLWQLIPDGDFINLSFLFPSYGRYLYLSHGFFEKGVSIMMGLDDFSFHYDKLYREVQFLPLDQEAGLIHFDVEVDLNEIILRIRQGVFHPYFDYSYLLCHNRFYRLTLEQSRLLKAIQSIPLEEDLSMCLSFHLEEQALLAERLLDFQTIGLVKAPKAFDVHDFVPQFTFSSNGEQLVLEMVFDYGHIQVSSLEELNRLPFTSHPKTEEAVRKLLQETGFRYDFMSQSSLMSSDNLYTFFETGLARFEQLGRVTLSETLSQLRTIQKPQIFIDQVGGLLDISFDFSNLVSEDVAKAMAALAQQEPYFISKTGQLVMFDDETKKVSQVLQYLRANVGHQGKWQLSAVANHELTKVFEPISSVTFSDHCRQMAYDLTHPEDYTVAPTVTSLPLRDYQLNGVKWLTMLSDYGFGGVLADDMGLGKTLQTIAFLKGRLTTKTKVLILAPSSLLYNWKDEYQRFTPDLKVSVSYGTREIREQIIAESPQILITSYNLFRQDFELYQSYSVNYLILDEAQAIKNSQTKIAQRLRDFDAKRCFALSGTPIENHLVEIWSIFQIVLPGLLPSKARFMKMTAQEVSRMISPFVLRRRKEDVLPELPSVIETTYYNDLTEEQKGLYIGQLQLIQDKLSGVSGKNFSQHKWEILSGLTRLRQICDSPGLFMPYTGDSGKLDSLRQLLVQLKESGHRALIFSQFKGMLELVKSELEALGLTSYQMTGSTSSLERQEMTKAFNKGSRDMFLISLKAGGVGLNLTGADTVVLIDLWWNPAVEDQAISRAHRLGQENHVNVYRLITKGTIEEKILELQESKKDLVATVLDGNDSRSSLTLEDIKAILGISE